MSLLQDGFGRRFYYLRLSITEECNFRCVYCLPNGYHRGKNVDSFLSLSEIKNLAHAFSTMGTCKIRITGGEPTLRRDLLEIVETIASTPGVKKTTLSTNGYRLRKLVPKLKGAGLTGVNVSLDSLDSKRFFQITGYQQFSEILLGIDAAIESGLSSIKVNIVLLGHETLNELPNFMDWIKERPVVIRFIELMPTAQNLNTFEKHHFAADLLKSQLKEHGWIPKPRSFDDGPAFEYHHSSFKGGIGIIAPYSTDFCNNCNRLRVSSSGALQLCLFSDETYSIRHLLQKENQLEELKESIISIVQNKKISHDLIKGHYGNNQTFSAIGG